MELQREKMDLQEVGFVIDSVASAEGVLTPPVNLPPVYKVLGVEGRANGNADASAGKVSVDGTVALSVTYLSEKGEMYGFESVAVFRHVVDNSEAQPDMTLLTNCSVADIRVAITTGGVNVRAEINVKCIGIKALSVPVAIDNGELQCKKVSIPENRLEHNSSELELREEMTLPSHAQTLIGTDGFARVDSVRSDPGRTMISGTVRLMTSYVTPDGYFEQVPSALPFECAFSENYDKAHANVQLQNLNCGLSDNDVMFVEVLLCVNLYGENEMEKEVLLDAYCTKTNMVATSKTLRTSKLETISKRETCRVNLPVPENMPQPSKILSVMARMTGKMENQVLMAKAFATVIYACAEDNIHAVNGIMNVDIPMEVDGESMISIAVDSPKATQTSNDFAINLTLDISGFAIKPLNFGVVEELIETEPFQADGPIIYFTNPGETLWDIGKRFCVGMDTLTKYNPNATENNAGERLLIDIR